MRRREGFGGFIARWFVVTRGWIDLWKETMSCGRGRECAWSAVDDVTDANSVSRAPGTHIKTNEEVGIKLVRDERCERTMRRERRGVELDAGTRQMTDGV